MVEESTGDSVLPAIADPTRRRVVELLCTGARRAGDLAAETGVTPSAMSRHLRVLLEAGVVEDERAPEDARVRLFRLRREPMRDLRAWLDQIQAHWNEQLQSYKRHVERP
jgi:DNA-binding transcriptional ArsR family regulator